MKDVIEKLEAFDEEKQCANAIVETPRGSRVKYSYIPESGLFRWKRTLPEGMFFPFNFGFIPSTVAADGDPLDILILNEEPAVLGSLVKVRLLAVIEAEQTETGKMVRNDRIVGAAVDEETPSEYVSLRLDDARVRQIVFFFAAYNKISGKEFKFLKTGGPAEAREFIEKGVRNFAKQKTTILKAA